MSDSGDSVMMDGAPGGTPVGGQGVSFGEAIKRGFRGYVSIGWRAPRSEYWFWALFVILCSIVANVIDALVGMGTPGGGGLVSGIVALGLLLPNICAGIRRLHDIDRSGWWWLIVFVPLVGFIVMIVFMCKRGTVGPNRFGPDPLA